MGKGEIYNERKGRRGGRGRGKGGRRGKGVGGRGRGGEGEEGRGRERRGTEEMWEDTQISKELTCLAIE